MFFQLDKIIIGRKSLLTRSIESFSKAEGMIAQHVMLTRPDLWALNGRDIRRYT